MIAVWLMMMGCGVEADGFSTLPSEAAGPPSMFLSVSDLIPGQPLLLTVEGAPPHGIVGVAATLVGTRSGATCPPALGGECLDLIQPRAIAQGRADGTGRAELRVTAPMSAPIGATAYLQAAAPAGPSVSYVAYAPVLDPACPQIVSDFHAEAAAIRSCGAPSDCGTVLSGTSCGCTRDWVARVGVSTARFYQLLGGAQQCGLALISTCDCPMTYGFDCVSNVCSWDYTP